MSEIREAISDLNIDVPSETQTLDNLFEPQWKDITTFLDEATQDFEVGQLVHLRSFSLLDAMSAIEIMDPKMDTGMVVETEKKLFDVEQHLQPAQLLWIMDRLLSCEMAWISGHSLSQTVYTCSYFHHIPALVAQRASVSDNLVEIIHTVLRAYTLATVKCCQYVWTEMRTGNVFEEEDFTTNLFGLSLNEHYSDSIVLNDIDSAILLLKSLIRRSTFSVERLQLRRSYLLALSYLSQPQCTHFGKAQEQLEDIVNLLATDGIIRTTLGTGTEVEGAFDPNINRKFTSQAPPRPITLHSDEESYSEFLLVIKRLQSICGAINFSSVRSLMNFFEKFASTQPYADAFSRSKLNSVFYHDSCIFGTRSVPQIVVRSIDELVKPPSWWLNPNSPIPNLSPQHVGLVQQTRQALSEFLERASFPLIDFFKIQCHNRARQRRILHKVLGEWEMLQEEAAGIDEALQEISSTASQPYYLSSWAYHLKLSMMENILELGFELDLYGTHEYVMVYWYLQYVLDSHRFLLERIIGHLSPSEPQFNRRKQKSKAKINANPVPSSDIQSLLLINQAKKNLSAGSYKILVAMQKSQQLNIRPVLFDDEATRFRHRLKPFTQLASPPFPSYDLYVKTITTDSAYQEGLLKAASVDFSTAKRALEAILALDITVLKTDMCHEAFQEDMLGMTRTCVANNVMIVRLLNADKTMSVKLGFKYHRWWPVIET
ncbi:hypothetical protein DFQ28_003928 [Apophysomyces sp. BC1034]|nr:hypothetical protein DFQ28_003928 [Apophysomyces sp. BC1034]